MKNRCSWSVLTLVASVVLAGCAGTENTEEYTVYETPTVDYVAGLNVKDAPHADSFLNQLAMNYRSYAVYNAKTSGYPDIAELFAQKAVTAFSGETPFPESLNSWQIADEADRFEIYTAYNDLINELQNDAQIEQPQLAAEAQAKFDCWISAASSGQNSTANECKKRFKTTLETLQNCSNGKVVAPTYVKSENVAPAQPTEEKYYPETRRLNSMSGTSRTRDGVVIVNNVNVAPTLVQPVPVPSKQKAQPPMVFNQNIYGGDETATDGDEVFSGSDNFDTSEHWSNTRTNSTSDAFNNSNTTTNTDSFNETISEPDGDYVSRDEFIALMMSMREELAAINDRLDNLNKPMPAPNNEKTVIKVQQIPLEPQQRIMEEIFEIRFDFDKAIIKPEYEDVIRKLAATTQANKNVKVSVVGHTDTVGSDSYNYALGGRRAEAVQKMLIEYGIPSAQIVAVSAGKEDLKVWTPDNTPNAENRRVRVVKETQYTEQPQPTPLVVEEYSETDGCEECDGEEI